MMTRKDYVTTAEILNKFLNKIDAEDFDDLVFEFGEMFLADNSKFSEDKFSEACYKE